MKKLLFIILLLAINFTFSQTEWANFEKDNFSIDYPKDWSLDTSGQMNSQFLLFSKVEENDTFRENVNLIIQDLKGQDMTLKSFIKLSENQITSMVENGKIIESENHGSYQSVIWSGFISGYNLKFKQFLFIKDEKANVLTFTALETTFDAYIETGAKILDSFKLK